MSQAKSSGTTVDVSLLHRIKTRTPNMFQWAQNDPIPLLERLLERPSLMSAFAPHRVLGMLQSLLTPASYIPSLDLLPFGHRSASDQKHNQTSDKHFCIRKVQRGCYNNTILEPRSDLKGGRVSLAMFYTEQAQGKEVIYLKLYLKEEVSSEKELRVHYGA